MISDRIICSLKNYTKLCLYWKDKPFLNLS
jgi:hypothetical protein